MKLFQRNTAAAIAKTRELLAAAEARLAEMGRERRAALLQQTDDLGEVRRIERAQDEERRTIAIYSDRLGALDVELRRERQEQRERERGVAIEKIQKRLAARDVLAVELEAAICKVGELYFALADSDNVAHDWPGPAPRPGFGAINLDELRREVGWAMFSAGRPIGGRSLFPNGTNAGLGITGIHPRGVAAAVAEHSRALIDQLRTALHEEDPADDVPAGASSAGPHGLAELAIS